MYSEPFLLMCPEPSEYREDSAEKTRYMLTLSSQLIINNKDQTELGTTGFTLRGVVVLTLLP